MVEDFEIKTTVSPFAVREGEIKTFDGKDAYVAVSQIVHKMNLGHISDVHLKILRIVNEFEFVTSRQIFQLLQFRGVEIPSQNKLNVKLDQLIKSKILTRYYFNSEEGKGIYRVYCLEKMGKYLLTAQEETCKWQPTDNTKPVYLMKKRLAANQAIIAFMRKSKNFDSYILKPSITAKMLGKTMKGNGSIKLKKANKSLDLLLECVRREDEWEKAFADRMRMLKDFLENFVPFDSGFESKPQLIFLCEDDKHMVETFKVIVTQKLEIEKMKIYFTTDLRQNADTLEKSLVEFVKEEDTGKYKANNVEFKFLG